MNKQKIAYISLSLWAGVVVSVCGILLGSHLVALPVPTETDPQLVAAMQAQPDDGAWQAMHFLYADCPCSQRVADHLADRGPVPGVSETVVLVTGESDYSPPKFSGMNVKVVDPTRLKADFGVAGAPMMAIATPKKDIRYSGGYTSRKQGPAIQDTHLIHAAMNNEPILALPLFGCGVSREFQARLNRWSDP